MLHTYQSPNTKFILVRLHVKIVLILGSKAAGNIPHPVMVTGDNRKLL